MSTQVTFQYQVPGRNLQRENLIRTVTQRVAGVITLPQFVEVYIYDLGRAVQGGVDQSMNRVILNTRLTVPEIPKILIHELIHVHQKFTGKLKVTGDGMYLWEGRVYNAQHPEKLTRAEYLALPWEADVINNLASVVTRALS
jgi:hypothetical protein